MRLFSNLSSSLRLVVLNFLRIFAIVPSMASLMIVKLG